MSMYSDDDDVDLHLNEEIDDEIIDKFSKKTCQRSLLYLWEGLLCLTAVSRCSKETFRLL